MGIVRTPKQNTKFVQIENSSLEDATLSLRAKGLLSYLLSCPNNFNIIINDLVKRSTDGKTSVRSALKELENSGYLRRERINGDKGYIRWEQVVYESPSLNPYWQNDCEGEQSPSPQVATAEAL